MSRYTCDAMGICQQRTPACLGCDHHALAQFVQASRNTGCCVPFDTNDATTDTLTKTERVAYWLGVGVVVGMSVVTVFGTAGYLVARFF